MLLISAFVAKKKKLYLLYYMLLLNWFCYVKLGLDGWNGTSNNYINETFHCKCLSDLYN